MEDLLQVLVNMGFVVTIGARKTGPLLPGVWIEIVDDGGNSVFFTIDENGNSFMSFTPLIKEKCECL